MGFKYLNKLQDKRIVIFGGSSGLGLAVAEACIEHGAIIALASSNSSKLSSVAEQLKQTYHGHIKENQIATFAIDLSLPRDQLEPQLKQLFDEFTPNGAKIDHVVFTAGNFPDLAPLDDLTAGHFADLLAVRTVAPTIIASVLTRDGYMAKSSASSITLTGATSSYRPMSGMSPYLPSAGAAIEGASRGLASALAPIRVNIVLAGTFDTPLTNRLPREVLEQLAEKTALKKIGRAEDIAEAYLYLMKDESATGISVVSDNGQSVHL